MAPIDLNDPRWGGYIPWFFRVGEFAATGNFVLFFERLSQRIDRLFAYNEAGIQNLPHFGDLLETESLQRFRHDRTKTLSSQVSNYFHPETLKKEFAGKIHEDPEVKKAYEILSALRQHLNLIRYGRSSVSNREKTMKELEGKVNTAELQWELKRKERADAVYIPIFSNRLGVVEVLLRILPESAWLANLKRDIRRFFAEAKIMLDIKGVPPLIVPIEEALLQRNVIDNLLPRLAERFPERAQELVQAYHGMLTGKDLDSIFIEAFKTLEEIARSITNDKKFEFERSNLKKYFPHLHATTHETMIKLAGHRGDKGGHGKASPPPHEIRYLLFTICNIALLLLEYPKIEKDL